MNILNTMGKIKKQNRLILTPKISMKMMISTKKLDKLSITQIKKKTQSNEERKY